MNKDYRRRDWSQDRFPGNIIRGIKGFFGRIFFWLATPFRKLLAAPSPLRERRRGALSWIIAPFLWLLWLLVNTFSNLVELIISWSSSRQTRAMLVAMPAAIAFGLFGFVIIYLYNSRSGTLINTYFLRATKAENVESYETARLYYQKLLQLDLTNQSYEFLIARSFESEGNLEEATRRMAKLRNQADVAGVVNFWFARKTLEREDLKEDQKWKLCLVYVEEFLAEAPKHKEANVLAFEANSVLAQMYASRNRQQDALDYLLKAEEKCDVLTRITERSFLALARIQRRISEQYAQLNDPVLQSSYNDASLRSIQQAINYFTEQLKESPRSIEYLLLLSDSYLFQKNYELAMRPIEIAMRNDIHNRLKGQFLEAKARIMAAWANELMQSGDQNLAQCIEVVDRALQLDPKNESALAILAQISVRNIDEVSLAAKQKLESAIGEASAPFTVHMILGSYAAAQNQDDLAMKHLRQALRLNNRATAVMNNLAFVMARLPDPRFKEALVLINRALEFQPGNPRFLDTRGNIYLRMKEYELAFHDLESAEAKIKNNAALYENLIFLTEKLGFDELYRKKFQQRLDVLRPRTDQPK